GADILLSVLPVILTRFPHVECQLVGPSSPLAAFSGRTLPELLMDTARDAAWQSRVTVSGAVSDDILRHSYADADILLFPSRHESFGCPVVEAMSFGLPVVACKAGGVSEIVVNDQTGLTVDVGDSRALIEALSELIVDSAKRGIFGRASRNRYLSNFTA